MYDKTTKVHASTRNRVMYRNPKVCLNMILFVSSSHSSFPPSFFFFIFLTFPIFIFFFSKEEKEDRCLAFLGEKEPSQSINLPMDDDFDDEKKL